MMTTEEFNDKPTGSNDGRTPTLTDEEIRALMEAATPGPLISGHDQDERWAVAVQHGPILAVMTGAPGPHNEANANLYAAAPDLAAGYLARGQQIAELQAIIADPDWCNDAMAAIIATERAEVLALRRRVAKLEARAIHTETLKQWAVRAALCNDMVIHNELTAIIAQKGGAENE